MGIWKFGNQLFLNFVGGIFVVFVRGNSLGEMLASAFWAFLIWAIYGILEMLAICFFCFLAILGIWRILSNCLLDSFGIRCILCACVCLNKKSHGFDHFLKLDYVFC